MNSIQVQYYANQEQARHNLATEQVSRQQVEASRYAAELTSQASRYHTDRTVNQQAREHSDDLMLTVGGTILNLVGAMLVGGL